MKPPLAVKCPYEAEAEAVDSTGPECELHIAVLVPGFAVEEAVTKGDVGLVQVAVAIVSSVEGEAI